MGYSTQQTMQKNVERGKALVGSVPLKCILIVPKNTIRVIIISREYCGIASNFGLRWKI